MGVRRRRARDVQSTARAFASYIHEGGRHPAADRPRGPTQPRSGGSAGVQVAIRDGGTLWAGVRRPIGLRGREFFGDRHRALGFCAGRCTAFPVGELSSVGQAAALRGRLQTRAAGREEGMPAPGGARRGRKLHLVRPWAWEGRGESFGRYGRWWKRTRLRLARGKLPRRGDPGHEAL